MKSGTGNETATQGNQKVKKRGEKKKSRACLEEEPFQEGTSSGGGWPRARNFHFSLRRNTASHLRVSNKKRTWAGGTGWLCSSYKHPTPPPSTQLRTIPLPRQLGCPTSNSEYLRCQATSLLLRDHLLVIQPDPSNRPSPLAAHTRM